MAQQQQQELFHIFLTMPAGDSKWPPNVDDGLQAPHWTNAQPCESLNHSADIDTFEKLLIN